MALRVDDIGFYVFCLLVLALTIGTLWLPAYFLRRVDPRLWVLLPIIHGAYFGALSVMLYFGGLIGLIGGPSTLLVVLAIHAGKRRVRWWMVAAAVPIQAGTMVATYYGLVHILWL